MSESFGQSSQCFERHQFRWRLSRVRKCKWDLPVIHISLVNVTAIPNLNDRCIILLLSIVSGWWWQFLRRSRDFTSGLTPREYCSPYSHWVGAITFYLQTSKAQKPEHANGFISSTLRKDFSTEKFSCSEWSVYSVNFFGAALTRRNAEWDQQGEEGERAGKWKVEIGLLLLLLLLLFEALWLSWKDVTLKCGVVHLQHLQYKVCAVSNVLCDF